MKRIFSFLAIVFVLFIASASITSCNTENASVSLEGTTWTATETTHGSTYSYTLTFGKSSFSLKMIAPTGSDGGTETIMYAGTYTYDAPVVSLSGDFNGEKTTLTGVREGNMITFTGKIAVTFTQK